MIAELLFVIAAHAATLNATPTAAPAPSPAPTPNFATVPYKGEVFEKLKAAAVKFRDARVSNELDQTIPAQSANKFQEENVQNQDFLESLQRFSKKEIPRLELKKENAEMNKTFKKIMANKEKSPWGTVTKDGVLKTQKAWVEYRNTWKQFARSEKGDADQVDAWLSRRRTQMLKSILGER